MGYLDLIKAQCMHRDDHVVLNNITFFKQSTCTKFAMEGVGKLYQKIHQQNRANPVLILLRGVLPAERQVGTLKIFSNLCF